MEQISNEKKSGANHPSRSIIPTDWGSGIRRCDSVHWKGEARIALAVNWTADVLRQMTADK